VTKEEAERRIREINEPYKLEILESILKRTPDAAITIYHIGEKDHPMHWWGCREGVCVWGGRRAGQLPRQGQARAHMCARGSAAALSARALHA